MFKIKFNVKIKKIRVFKLFLIIHFGFILFRLLLFLLLLFLRWSIWAGMICCKTSIFIVIDNDLVLLGNVLILSLAALVDSALSSWLALKILTLLEFIYCDVIIKQEKNHIFYFPFVIQINFIFNAEGGVSCVKQQKII